MKSPMTWMQSLSWTMTSSTPRVVIGENLNFMGNEELLRSRGVELVIVQDKDCIQVMGDFIKESPDIWNEDIGV